MRVEKDKDTGPPGNSLGMFDAGTDGTLASRQLQRIQERRMYLSQQQYVRESEELRNYARAPSYAHTRNVLSNILADGHQNGGVQRPPQNASASYRPSTSAQANVSWRTNVRQPGQEMPVSSNRVASPSSATSSNQVTVSADQLHRRQDLLMEVLSQFENKGCSQQNTSCDYSKRHLNSNNGVAFDWGKLPRIGSVHSVQGIVGPQSVQTSSVEAKDSSNEAVSRMGKVKMSELARIILNGAFDYFISPSSPATASVGSNSTPQGNEIDSNIVSGTQNQMCDPQGVNSSKDVTVNSVPAQDYIRPYHTDRPPEVIPRPLSSSFNQTTPQAVTYSSSNATTRTPNVITTGSYPQSNLRTSYNTSYNYRNISQMTQGQTRGAYGPTPVQTSYPRSLRGIPDPLGHMIDPSSRGIPHPLSSIPMNVSMQPTMRRANESYRAFYPQNQNPQFVNRSVRTARVEPLSDHFVRPRLHVTQATTSDTSTRTSTTVSQQLIFEKDQHDSNNCLDCQLFGTCQLLGPIKKAIMTAESTGEKEKDLGGSSSNDEEPELIITKVTTKEAERGPIERIDVDEWARSLEFLSEIKVKKEPVDEEEVTTNEVKTNKIDKSLLKLQSMVDNAPFEDIVLDSIVLGRNEHSSVDTNLNSNSFQDSNTLNKQPTAVSEDASAQAICCANITFDRLVDSEVTEESIALDLTDAAMDRQVDSEVSQESVVLDLHVTDTIMDRQTAPDLNTDITTIIRQMSEVTDPDSLVSSDETSPETFVHTSDDLPSSGNDEHTAIFKDNNSTEAIVTHVDQEDRSLAMLIKKIASLETYLNVLKRNTEEESDLGFPSENEYDKGDQNYEKYVLMEGRELADEEPVKLTDTSTKDNYGSGTIRRPTRKMVKRSLQDQEVLEKLEKALATNQDKLKNQNVVWIRKNCLKARLKILKRIERITSKYETLQGESLLSENLKQTRNFQGSPLTMEGAEKAAPERNTENVVPIAINQISVQEKVHELKRNHGNSQGMSDFVSEESPVEKYPKQMEFDTNADLMQEIQEPRNESNDQDVEEVNGKEHHLNNERTSRLENSVLALDNERHVGEQENEAISGKNTNPLVDPKNGLAGYGIKKSERLQNSNTRGKDAIETFVELPNEQQDECSSLSSLEEDGPYDILQGLQNENQENMPRFPNKGRLDQAYMLVSDDSHGQMNTQLCKESLSINYDMNVDKDQYNPLSKNNDKLLNLNGSTSKVLESNAHDELNYSPEMSCSLPNRFPNTPNSSSTNQFREDANISKSAMENPDLDEIVRKGKRKSNDREDHVVVNSKKEKIDAEQEVSWNNEESSNIWDIILTKFSSSC